jgi:hypothetical protein
MIMAKHFKLNAYTPDGYLIANCADHMSAGLLMSLYGDGSTIRYKNAILWTEGVDGEGAQSYDGTMIKVYERLNKVVRLV